MLIGYASSARAFKLAMFLVSQRDNNAITNATNEFKRVLILASDFVYVMSQNWKRPKSPIAMVHSPADIRLLLFPSRRSKTNLVRRT